MDLRRRPDRSLTVIAALKAQVVVLQEADKRLPPRPAALPHQMISDDGWQVLPFGQPGGSLGWHGNAMLVRPGIGLRGTRHLELPGLEPRGAICADLCTPLGALRIIGVHLGLLRRYRLLQVGAIARALRDMPPLPTVIAGDFNEWGSDRPMDVALQGQSFVPARPSFPAIRPIAPLDRFAISPTLRVMETGVHTAQPAHVASDHLPVWIDLERA